MLEVVIGDSRFFACEACGMVYSSKDLAKECEAWCNSHGSCNLDITKNAIGTIRRAGLRIGRPRP